MGLGTKTETKSVPVQVCELTIENACMEDEGYYFCRARNEFNEATSSWCKLGLEIVITKPPKSVRVLAGGQASFRFVT
jgi:hypothetical protein